VANLLVDSDILIDTGRGVADAVSFLQRHVQSGIGISTINQLELLIGARNRIEQMAVDRFLQRFEVLKLTEQIADGAVDLIRRYRLSHGLLLADALVAATALSVHIPLATKNQRDYRL
jgi:predicted nucleic acid-binding protein